MINPKYFIAVLTLEVEAKRKAAIGMDSMAC